MTPKRTIWFSLVLIALAAAPAVAQTSVGWGNLQWPLDTTDPACSSTGIYGQVWVDGLTQDPGQAPGLIAELGFGPVGSTPDASWNWVPATFNVDVGNNDEYVVWVNFYLPYGLYHYTYRYMVDGDAGWYYAAERGTAEFTTNCGAVGNEAMSWSALKKAY